MSSVKYLAKPLSTFHQINAYEDHGFLVLDMCASDDGLAIANYNIQNLRKSGEALDEVRVEAEEEHAAAAPRQADQLLLQVYNTMCRVFPRRFVLPLNVDSDTAYNQNLNVRYSSTATAIRTGPNKVSGGEGEGGENGRQQASTNRPAWLCRSAARTRTSTGRTCTATEAWSSPRSTTGGATCGPTATFTAVASDTWLETR